MQVRVVTACLTDKGNLYKTRGLGEDDPRQIAKTLAPISPMSTKDIAAEQGKKVDFKSQGHIIGILDNTL